jgi:glucosamine--fructose-6-phosphate aminotransferase (isomerizing)
MYGIVGYIGLEDSKEILLKGLAKLEYRGYDSAGIGIKNEQAFLYLKKRGVSQIFADMRLR